MDSPQRLMRPLKGLLKMEEKPMYLMECTGIDNTAALNFVLRF